MVDYATAAPGIHVEEITPAGPIEGAGTSVAALIGTTATLPTGDALGKPVPVTSWNAYKDRLGEYKAGQNLPYAVRGFFDNGGTFAYVVPIKDMGGLDGALAQLSRLPDVGLVCVPGLVDPALQKDKVIKHCEDLGDRFAILDGIQDKDPLKPGGALLTQRAGLLSPNGFGALYWPWITIRDPAGAAADTIAVPPSGHLAGVMARCDSTVGVHKAPANEQVRGAVGLDFTLNDTEQGALNKQNINALRVFPGGPPLVWGARTLSADVPWRFVNVRRLVSYVEDSLVAGLRWAVFEPNTPGLWKGLQRSITEFLTRVWEAGGLFGRSAKEAFYVTIDESLNPAAVRDRGEVIVEIGLAVTRPAEHIVLRIGLWDGGAKVSEG
ncbi:phage tail sheath subtilisin-like domain-containing protein [Kribbella sp. NPDC026611]|uniref:phage tail sheath family protein n=1 Tax=Kribbella sp. NPDC026611 TaxID=3154911 RepID=UPI003400B6B9